MTSPAKGSGTPNGLNVRLHTMASMDDSDTGIVCVLGSQGVKVMCAQGADTGVSVGCISADRAAGGRGGR